jgi:hypothetical protein
MRGAVLYKLGLDFVKDRVMRRSYGINTDWHFRHGYHPESRKRVGLDGATLCKGLMFWFVTKVVHKWMSLNYLRKNMSQPGE